MKKNLIFVIVLSILIISTLFGCGKKAKYEVIDTYVNSDSFSMPAKITIPISEGKVPAIVMIHGSGPNDMNESIGKLKMFEDLAINLALNGVASIRYDKRTLTYQQIIATDKYFTIQDEVIDDVLSAIRILKQNDKIDEDNIYILGHSFGGQLAPVIANLDNDVKGVIIMGGTTMHLIDLMMEQLKEQNSPYYDEYDPWDEYFRDMKEVKESEIGYYFGGAYMTYWVSYNNIDYNDELVKFSKNGKLLVLHGKKDLQVKQGIQENYYNLLKDTNGIYKVYEDLNHSFVDGGNETMNNAYNTKKSIPSNVINDIFDFIKS